MKDEPRRHKPSGRGLHQMLTLRGETMSIVQWGARLGLSISAIRSRLSRGWDIEEALGTPSQGRGGDRHGRKRHDAPERILNRWARRRGIS